MNILFIEKKLRADKLGICYLSRILKDAGHTVGMIQADIEDVESYFGSHTVDVVMWSVSSGEQDWVLTLNRALKSKFKFVSIVGGPHFTYFPEQGEKDPDINFVVQGPGELVIVNLVEGRIKDKVIKGHLPLLDQVKPPDRSLIYKYDEFKQSPMKRFMAARSCKWSCSYCFNHVFRKLYADERDKIHQITQVGQVLKEVLEVKNTYGLELAYFNDDNLASDISWLENLCDGMNRLGIKFCGSVRVEDVDENLIRVMAASGCTFLNMALEAGSPETLKLLRRSKSTPERLKQIVRVALDSGIKIRIQNMIGLPVENILEDALYTLQCNIDIGPTDSWVSVYQPYRKTDLAEYCVTKGFISTDYVPQGQYDRSQFVFPDSEKIYRLSKLWWFFVAHRIDMDFVRTLLEIPMTDDQLSMIQDIRLQKSKMLLYNF